MDLRQSGPGPPTSTFEASKVTISGPVYYFSKLILALFFGPPTKISVAPLAITNGNGWATEKHRGCVWVD